MHTWKLALASIFLSVFLAIIIPSILTIKNGTIVRNYFSSTSSFDTHAHEGIFLNKKVSIPSTLAENNDYHNAILGEKITFGDIINPKKRIYVDLTKQRLYAYEGNKQVYNFLVSTGKWGRTPTGTFRIWIKLRYTLMSGGSKEDGTYYYLPNVPFTMFFYNDEIPQYLGYGIHGTYWHNNFGHPMSHGCINMKNEEVEQLYYWADPKLGDKVSVNATEDNPGTEIIIYGKTPTE